MNCPKIVRAISDSAGPAPDLTSPEHPVLNSGHW
jgi:hypothetical protein